VCGIIAAHTSRVSPDQYTVFDVRNCGTNQQPGIREVFAIGYKNVGGQNDC
jgi:hypothetical protein